MANIESTTTGMPTGKYTSEKLFLQLDPTEFNSHESDINNYGQIAFVSNGDSSFIYAKGVKVGGSDININDLDLSSYATKTYVTNAVGALDASYTASQGKYVSGITQTNGKITSVISYTLPTISVDNNNKEFTIGSNKYTLMINNNVLSIQEDIPVTFKSFSANPATLKTSGSDINRGTDYVGKQYSGGTVQKTVNNTTITLTATVNNPQGKQFSYSFTSENGTIIHSGTSTGTSVSCTVNQTDYFTNGTSQTAANGTFTWDGVTKTSKITCKSNTDKDGTSNTDTVYNERFSFAINNGTANTAIVVGGQSCSFTAQGKVLIAYATSSNSTDNLTTTDITKNGKEYTTIKTIKVNAGITCTIYVPTCLNISPTITIAGVNVIPTSFKKETKTLTINGCTTEYHVYTKLAGAEAGSGYEYSISFS